MVEIERSRQEPRRETYPIKEVPLWLQRITLASFETVANVGGFSTIPKLVLGKENIPDSPPYIVVANHRGVVEPGVLWRVFRLGETWIHFVVKSGTVLEWWWDRVGMIPVKRGEPDRKALNTAIKYLTNGQVVGILPEGTRGGDELTKLNEFKEGMGFIATQAKVPVIPVAMVGPENMMAQIDRRGFNFLKERQKIISTKPKPEIEVAIGEPIIGITDRREVTRLCSERMSQLIAFLEGE